LDSFPDQLWVSFGQQLSSFGELLWDAAFAGNFGEQFWGRIYIWIIPNYIFKYPNI
jgi:hypothetical protein